MDMNCIKGMLAFAALAVASVTILAPDDAAAARWGENYFPNSPVVTHEGKTVRFYDDLIRGKIVVINFIYASCTDLCSLSTARLARVREMLGDSVGRDVFIYTITIDPENDTPEVLRKFAEAFGAGDGWLFLTGKPEDIHQLRWKLGERSRSLSEHRSDMVLGNDREGFWRRISAMGNLKILSQRILEMDPAVAARYRARSAGSLDKKPEDYRIENHPGEALYLKACSFCHTVGRGNRFGPDLQGVTARREHDWLVRFMRAPGKMLADNDPIAVKLNAEFPDVKMPYLDLSEDDAEDVIAYLEAQDERLAAEADSATGEGAHNHDDHHHDHDDHHHDDDQLLLKHPTSSEGGMEVIR